MNFSFSVVARNAAVATYYNQWLCCCNQMELLCALYGVSDLCLKISNTLKQSSKPALNDSKYPGCHNFQWSGWNLILIQVHSYVFMYDTVWD